MFGSVSSDFYLSPISSQGRLAGWDIAVLSICMPFRRSHIVVLPGWLPRCTSTCRATIVSQTQVSEEDAARLHACPLLQRKQRASCSDAHRDGERPGWLLTTETITSLGRMPEQAAQTECCLSWAVSTAARGLRRSRLVTLQRERRAEQVAHTKTGQHKDGTGSRPAVSLAWLLSS